MANSKLIKFKDKKGNEYPYLYIDEMTGEFYAVKRIADTIKKRPLGKEFVKARSNVLHAIQEMTENKPVIKGNHLISDYYSIMIDEKRELGIKASTLKSIDGIWRNRIAPYWGHALSEDISQAMITEYMKWHRRKLPGVQFVNTFKYLGNIFNVMVERGALDVSKLPSLSVPKDEQKHHDKEKGRYVTPEEVISMLNYCDDDMYILIAATYAAGFRKTEFSSLKKSQLKLAGNYFIVKLDTDDTKTGMAREVPLPKALTERIKIWLNLTNSDFLFPMKSDNSRPIYSQLIDKEWVDLKKKAAIKGRLRYHDLRHSAARNFAKSNVNPIIACTILGMSLAMYQKVYCKMKASDLIMAIEQSAAQVGVA